MYLILLTQDNTIKGDILMKKFIKLTLLLLGIVCLSSCSSTASTKETTTLKTEATTEKVAETTTQIKEEESTIEETYSDIKFGKKKTQVLEML